MATECLTNEAPFVHKTLLGWGIVGSLGTDSGESNMSVLRTSVSQIEHYSANFEFPKYHQLGTIPHVKDSLIQMPDDDLPGYSQDDVKFCEIMS